MGLGPTLTRELYLRSPVQSRVFRIQTRQAQNVRQIPLDAGENAVKIQFDTCRIGLRLKMDTPSDVLSFVKALASADRLRVVGLLSMGSKRAAEIAESLGVHPSEVSRHLEQLTSSGIVHEADGAYELDERAIESLARSQFEGKRPAYVTTGEDRELSARAVLKSFLNADGTIKQIPLEGRKLLVILNYVLDAFAFGVVYTEKEVNAILRRFHVDTAALRRYLVDRGMVARESDGSTYWRVKDG